MEPCYFSVTGLGRLSSTGRHTLSHPLAHTQRFHLHFVVQLLDAAVFAWDGELGALQDGLAAGHVAVDLCEVHVKPEDKHKHTPYMYLTMLPVLHTKYASNIASINISYVNEIRINPYELMKTTHRDILF